MAKSIVEQAKSIEIKRRLASLEPELALAWLKDEVRLTQIAKVKKMSLTRVYDNLSRALREAYRKGDLIIKK